MRPGDVVLALGCLIAIGFGAGQFVIGAYLFESNFIMAMWTIGCLAEVWAFFWKIVLPLKEWFDQR